MRDPSTLQYEEPFPAFYTGAQDVPPPYAANMADATPSAVPREISLLHTPVSSEASVWATIPRRGQVVIILMTIFVAWWLLGKFHPAVRKAHRAVGPGLAGTSVTTAAVGTV